jgi:very-long-chain ceramide synthase
LFGLFVVTWLATRHVAYLIICWSVYKDGPRIGGPGCFQGSADALEGPQVLAYNLYDLTEPFRNPTGKVCMDKSIFTGFLVFLLALQGTMIVWSVFIVRVVVRVLSGNDADDIRSDDEEDEETENIDKLEDGFHLQQAPPFEEEVGVEGLNFELIERRGSPKRPGNSSGFSMPGHSDRKEILNRIGCDKQIN